MKKSFAIFPIFLLSLNACQKTETFYYKDYKIPSVYSQILDDYWNNHYDDLINTLRGDLNYEYLDGITKEKIETALSGELSREKLKIGFASGRYGDAYIVYICYDYFFYGSEAFMSLTPPYTYTYSSQGDEVETLLGTGITPHRPLLYLNHEFFSLDEAFESGILTKENTMYLQYFTPKRKLDCHETFAMLSPYTKKETIEANLFIEKVPEKIAKLLNNQATHLKFSKKVSKNDIDICYSIPTRNGGHLYFVNVPKLGIEQGKGEIEAYSGPDYHFTNHSDIEPFVGFSRTMDTPEVMTLQEAYQTRGFIPDITPECLEQTLYFLENRYIGNWGYFDNFNDYIEN